MPGLVKEDDFKTLTVKGLHPTFAAEVSGVDFQNLSEEQFQEILAAMAKYGVCVFRDTGLDDDTHVDFSRRLGDLDDIRRYMHSGRKLRYKHYELFDAGNIDDDGKILDPTSQRAHANKGNGLWHVDSSFNPRRASYSLLRACELPPPDTGGNTEFADSRTAFDELPEDLRQELQGRDLVGVHSHICSRKKGSPEFFKDIDPTQYPMYRHRIVQRHEPSGRMNVYVGAHLHHIEEDGKEVPNSAELVDRLNRHVAQSKYTLSVGWHRPGDLIIWDNRCVQHRSGPNPSAGKYKRDLRRTTVHDDSPTAWGLNDKDAAWNGIYVPKTVKAA